MEQNDSLADGQALLEESEFMYSNMTSCVSTAPRLGGRRERAGRESGGGARELMHIILDLRIQDEEGGRCGQEQARGGQASLHRSTLSPGADWQAACWAQRPQLGETSENAAVF